MTYQDEESKHQTLTADFDSLFDKIERIEKDITAIHEAILFLCGSLRVKVEEADVE